MLPKPIYTAAMDNGRYTTVEGHFVDVKLGGEEEVEVNDAMVTDADVSADNGIIHTINKVLMPVSGKKYSQNVFIVPSNRNLHVSMCLRGGVLRDSPISV